MKIEPSSTKALVLDLSLSHYCAASRQREILESCARQWDAFAGKFEASAIKARAKNRPDSEQNRMAKAFRDGAALVRAGSWRRAPRPSDHSIWQLRRDLEAMRGHTYPIAIPDEIFDAEYQNRASKLAAIDAFLAA